ncbi:putative pectinesterase family protein [Phaeoacremonium minimum UCRPA7]|uniref:pectinesterase n=1 Tax=Phaeoacremonium minimum (strain UCR-PA7) TaxID=1286976 RepID=R8BPH6_PHAM7|nr:putative pectinesterase family protein [Phaeoacremonium minimum UCRPA7]EOO01239.1 putative pectinesterase family protein [Phaeoacremonium minimum UCRPA7]
MAKMLSSLLLLLLFKLQHRFFSYFECHNFEHLVLHNTDEHINIKQLYLDELDIECLIICRDSCHGRKCSNYASGLIANSYLEAADKVISTYPSLYIYGSTITATSKNALLVYNKGATYGTVQYNSTIVFDTCSVIQKAGTTNTYVYMASANGAGSVVVYRNTALASLIAATGAHVDTVTQNTLNAYFEYLTTGAGSYQNNQASRSPYVKLVTDAAQLAPYGLANFFANAYPSVATTSITWIDPNLKFKLQFKLDIKLNVQLDLKLNLKFNFDTARIVGPAGSCANYTTISAAVADLPLDSTTGYIYILAGVYNEQVVFPNARTGATTFRGESASPLVRSGNTVTIRTTGAVLSSAGGSAATGAFQSTQYYTNQITFYNIDFENNYTPTTNYQAVAVSIKAKKAAFYNCNIESSQGTLLLNYGSFYFSNCKISGTQDWVWGQGLSYIYNSEIVETSTSTGQTIAAQQYQTSVGSSGIVFDHCAVVPESSSVPTGATYLGRDYSLTAHVAYVNSYLDNHIAAIGWKISSSSSSPVFVESNNTGPGSSTTSRSSSVQVLSDSSSYSAASVLGDVSWLDSSAIAPFSGFPDSVYSKTATTSSSTSSTATSTSTSAAVATTATSASAIYTVAPTPTGSQYGSVMSAVAALPSDGKAYTIYILAGTYNEQVWVNRTGMVTLRGETSYPNDYSQNLVTIQFKYGVLTSANQNELTPVINAKKTDGSGLALYNIDFTNTYPQTSNTAALAADFYGKNMAAYGCSFKGFQDTLLANQGVQLFSNCYIEGSIDYIFGYSKAYFHQCYIASNTAGYITAQNRPTNVWPGGYVFDSCYVTYTSSYGSSTGTTYLGRPWSQYAIVVYMNSYLDKHIAAEGWHIWSTSSPQTSRNIQRAGAFRLKSGPVMIIGYTEANPGQTYVGNTVTITNARGLSVSPLPTGHSNAETATIATGSTKISMYNINVINSDNLDGSQSSYVTLAASIYGNHIGFYGCSFIGWQDTLLTGEKTGYQYYEASYTVLPVQELMQVQVGWGGAQVLWRVEVREVDPIGAVHTVASGYVSLLPGPELLNSAKVIW